MQPHSSELGQKMSNKGVVLETTHLRAEVCGDGLSTHNSIAIHQTEVSMMCYHRKQSCDLNS